MNTSMRTPRLALLNLLCVWAMLGGFANVAWSQAQTPTTAPTPPAPALTQPPTQSLTQPPTPTQPAAPASAAVAKRSFRVEFTLSGHLEPALMHEAAIQPREWAVFRLIEAPAHGVAVKKGQPMLRLDLTDIDRQIEDRKHTAKDWDDWDADMKRQIALLEVTTPLDLLAARLAHERAQIDLDRFLKVDRPFQDRDAQLMVKNAQDALLYAQEELRQLTRMYDADDLREETEEIIIKRTRDMVERAEWGLKRAQVTSESILKQGLPRREEDLKQSAERAAAGWTDAQESLPRKLRKLRTDYARGLRNRERQAEDLRRLIEDREMMKLTAPFDGVAYHGPSSRGTFPSVAATGAQLLPGSTLKAHQVYVTLVAPGALVARVDLPEDRYRLARAGLVGRLSSPGAPGRQYAATLRAVEPAAVGAGKFELRADVPAAEGLLPGMSCKLRVVARDVRDALAVPAGAVREEEGQKLVQLKGNDGKLTDRVVRVGETAGGWTEVLEGLKEGEEVMLNPPAPAASGEGAP